MDAWLAGRALPEILRPDERTGPRAAPGLLRFDLQREILPISAIGKSETLANKNSRRITPIGVANREFAGVAVGELRINSTGKIRPTDELLQSVGRGLAAGPLGALGVAAGLLALQRIGPLQAEPLRRATELDDDISAALRDEREGVAVDDNVAINRRRIPEHRAARSPGDDCKHQQKDHSRSKAHSSLGNAGSQAIGIIGRPAGIPKWRLGNPPWSVMARSGRTAPVA